MIVITGGTQGIGKAILKKFAAAKHNIVACARNISELKNLKNELQKIHNIEFYYFSADLSKTEDIIAFANFVKSLPHPIEALINNAGVFIPGSIIEESYETYFKVMKTNVDSAYILTKELMPLFLKQKSGHIFNMCSVASIQPYPNGGSYSISKYALIGFSKCLREELKPHQVKVTSILPGATMSRSWEGSGIEEERLSPASDIAEMVFSAFKLSKRSNVEEILIRPQLGDL